MRVRMSLRSSSIAQLSFVLAAVFFGACSSEPNSVSPPSLGGDDDGAGATGGAGPTGSTGSNDGPDSGSGVDATAPQPGKDGGSHPNPPGPDGSTSTDSGQPSTGDDGGNPTTGDDGGGPPPPACSCAGGPSNCAVWQHVFMTNYGFNDNSCQVESQHDCGNIAYPGLGPKQHQVATEGAGTYDDPITAAAAGSNSGGSNSSQGGATLSPGTIIYNPLTQKYYIMEDQCAECSADYSCKYDDDEPKGTAGDPPASGSCSTNQYIHIDFWMGPTVSQDDPTNLNNCEDNTTVGDAYNVNNAVTGSINQPTTNGTVIINPPSNLPVRSGVLFAGDTSATGGCWVSTQLVPQQESCN
jgi:hypothetical protein